jgi:hypothetical protein|tara:strand:- start:36 stop:320 length:285 start_codon:yes stop_codon:yes gene_type:complete
MTRYHTNKNGNTPFTAEEEKAADAADIEYEKQLVVIKWLNIRRKRDKLLAACDWMVMSDTPDISDAWKTYRQALRDLPASESDPDDITWPDAPS